MPKAAAWLALLARFVVVTVIMGLVGVAPVSAECPVQNEPAAFASDVAVFLRLDKMTYKLTDEMTIDVGIRNDASEPLYVYAWIYWGLDGGFMPIVRDASGKDALNYSSGPDALYGLPMPPPSNNSDISSFVELRGGAFYGRQFETAARELIDEPGTYTLQFQYRGPMFCNMFAPTLQQLPILWHENAGILSNQVTFRVIK